MNLMGFLILKALLEPPPLRDTVGIIDIDRVYTGYVEAALWTTLDERDDNEHEHLDATCGIEDIDPEAKREMWDDCVKFVDDHYTELVRSGLEDEDVGHNFWLDRNGHGTGFRDRDIPEALGQKLSNAAAAMGQVDLFVNDHGKVEAM